MRAQLADGRILEFPDGTDPTVVQATVKKVLGAKAAPPAATPPSSTGPGGPIPGGGAKAPTAEPTPRSASEKAGFVAGNINKNVADLLGLPVDVSTQVANLGVAGISPLIKGAGFDLPDPAGPQMGGSESIKGLMRKLGIIPSTAEPRDRGERIAAAALEAGPTALLTKRLPGSGVQQAVRTTAGLGQAALAGAAPQAAAELGAGPEGQVLAGFGAQVGGPAALGVAEYGRKKMVGNTNVQSNVDAQRRAGIANPSPGVAANSKVLQRTEGTMGVLPGAADVQHQEAHRRQQGMGAKVDQVARGVSPTGQPVSNEQAGAGIQAGVEGFVGNFRQTQDQLYNRVRALIPAQRDVKVSNYEGALREFTRTIKGAEATTGRLVNDKLAKLGAALEEDLNAATQPQPTGLVGPGGQSIMKAPAKTVRALPYEAADLVRKRIGEQLEDVDLVAGTPKNQLKKLYGAITSDIEGALPKGSPERKAWDRARSYTRAGHDRIDTILQPLYDKGTPEKAFKAAMSGTREGSSAFRRIMRSLPPKQADAVRANVIGEMGQAKPGAQSAQGGTFSMDTFVTQWNQLHPDAKRVLFADPKVRADMETIAKVASDYKQAGRFLYNPSGTGRTIGHASAAASIITALGTGNLGLAAGETAGIAGSYGLARAMARPEFVSWLAKGFKTPADQRLKWLAQLDTIADRQKDPEDREVLSELTERIKAEVTQLK